MLTIDELQLDRYDQHILKILQEEGRISNQELADKIGLSPSPCLRRVRALEENGYIAGYCANLNANKIGLKLTALLYVSMDQHTPERFSHFEEKIKKLPFVLECLLITGQEADYQLKIIVQDMDDYHELLINHITKIEGVSGVHSSFVLREVFQQPLPIVC